MSGILPIRALVKDPKINIHMSWVETWVDIAGHQAVVCKEQVLEIAGHLAVDCKEQVSDIAIHQAVVCKEQVPDIAATRLQTARNRFLT